MTLPSAVVGFAITIYQVVKAKSAAIAAREAAVAAEEALSSKHLMVLLPQLHRVESELDSAVDNGDRRLAAYHMSQWRWQASQLRGFIEGEPSFLEKLHKGVQTSITLCAAAKIDVLDVKNDLANTARPVQLAIAEVTAEAGHISIVSSKSGSGA